MTKQEAIKWFNEELKDGKCSDDCPQCNAYELALISLQVWGEDGCTGCKFEHIEEWEMPCKKCKRNCKDYWRSKEVKE